MPLSPCNLKIHPELLVKLIHILTSMIWGTLYNVYYKHHHEDGNLTRYLALNKIFIILPRCYNYYKNNYGFINWQVKHNYFTCMSFFPLSTVKYEIFEKSITNMFLLCKSNPKVWTFPLCQ